MQVAPCIARCHCLYSKSSSRMHCNRPEAHSGSSVPASSAHPLAHSMAASHFASRSSIAALAQPSHAAAAAAAGMPRNAGKPLFELAINARSKRLVEDSLLIRGSFLERQKLFQQRHEQRLLQLAALAVLSLPPHVACALRLSIAERVLKQLL